MFTIGHAKLQTNEEENKKLLNIINNFSEIRNYGLSLTNEVYQQKLINNEINISSRGKTKGNPVKYDTWLEQQMVNKFSSLYSRKFIHNAFKDCQKVSRRKSKEDKVIKKSENLNKKRTNKKKSW